MTHELRPAVRIELPGWVEQLASVDATLAGDEERMRLVIALARENVQRGAGGPFAAAVFESGSGRIVSVGLNLVVPLRSSLMHAEVVAILMAQTRLGSYTLAAPGMAAHELVTSCEPCAMCLGATLWSGVRRLICGATRYDAQAVAFDEGPVFPESYRYLEQRGIEVVRGVARSEASAVLELYARRGGPIYNP